jgi:hypothetical protein
MYEVERERMSTEHRDARPSAADRDPTSDMIASALKDESPELQQPRDSAPDDPEAPPWNFLFLFPLAILVLFTLFGLVMCSDP